MLPNKMYLDCAPLEQPEGTHREARNIVHDPRASKMISEPGFTALTTYPSNLRELFKIDLPDDAVLIVSKDYTGGEEGVYDEFGVIASNNSYTRIFKTNVLELPLNGTYQGICHQNHQGERIVVWVSGKGPAKILNIDDLPFDVDTDKVLLEQDRISLLNLFLDAKVPFITKCEVKPSGGYLDAGSYQFAVAYEMHDGSRSSYSYVFNPVAISGGSIAVNFPQYAGSKPGAATSKSIGLTMSNLDIRYEKLVLAVIKHVESATTAEEIGTYSITEEGTAELNYSGSELGTPLALEEILIPAPNYENANTIEYHDKQLYLGNLETLEVIDAQEDANNIISEYTLDGFVCVDGIKGSHKDGGTIFNTKFFMPDEVYAFYISWIRNDGSRLPAVHIPGREVDEVTYFEDAGLSSVPIADNESIQNIIDHATITNQGYLTEDMKITSTGDLSLKLFHTRPTGGADGKMAYWENSETYPDNYPGTLSDGVTPYAGTPVRHHKFPSTDELIGYNGIGEFVWEDTTSSTPSGNATFSGDIGSPINYPEWDTVVTSLPAGVSTAQVPVIDYFMGADTVHYNKTVKEDTWLSGSKLTLTTTQERDVDIDLEWELDLHKNTWTKYVSLMLIEKLDSGGNFIETIAYNFNMDAYEVVNKHWTYTGNSAIHLLPGEKIAFTALTSCNETYWNTYSSGTSFNNIPPDIIRWGFDATLQINVEAGGVVNNPDYDGTRFGRGYGIRFSNIEVPEALQGKVQGYEIFYAKRDFSNSTVISQSVLFNPEDAAGALQVATPGDLDNLANKFSHHGFDLLANSSFPGIQPTHIKAECAIVDGSGGQLFDADQDYRRFRGTTYDWATYGFRSIVDGKYKPFDQSHNREERYDGSVTGTMEATAPNAWILANLCSYKQDAYKIMESQELVSTGRIYLVHDNTSGVLHTTNAIYSGDVHFGEYGLRTTYWEVPGSGAHTAFKEQWSFLCFTALNSSLRYEGTDFGEQFPPKIDTTDYSTIIAYLGLIATDPDEIMSFTNFVAVDTNLSRLNEMNRAYPYNRDKEYIYKFPYRIAVSEVLNDEGTGSGLRKFLSYSYQEMSKNKGAIVNLASYGSDLLIHCEDTLYRTVSRAELTTSEEMVLLGSGDLFRMSPTEVVPSSRGYGGLEHLSGAYVSKVGYTWIDTEAGKVFLWNGELKELSSLGLKRYFTTNKSWKLNDQLTLVGLPLARPASSVNGGIGYAIVLDEKYNRLLITKRDYTLNNPDTWVEEDYLTDAAGAYGYTVGDEGIVKTEDGVAAAATNMNNNRDFTFVGFTISFNLETEGWSAFHDYAPNMYIERKQELLSIYDSELYLHNVDLQAGQYHGDDIYSSKIDIVLNAEPTVSKTLKNLKWKTGYESEDGVETFMTFDRLVIFNDTQCSGEITLTPEDNVKWVEETWRMNKFYDYVVDNSEPFLDDDGEILTANIDLDQDVNKIGRIFGKYAIIRIKNTNILKNVLSLYGLFATANKSIR